MTVEEKEWIGKLNRIGISYFRPLVVATLALNRDVHSEDRVELFKAIERFIFLCFRMAGYQGSYGSSIFNNNARELFKGNIKMPEITKKLNEMIDKNISEIIESFIVKNNRKSASDGFYGWGSIGYFLFEYELALAKETKEVKVHWSDVLNNKKNSIEHILPQSPTDPYWRDRFPHNDDGKMKRLTGSLGNLLLLDQGFNSSYSNKPFPQKKSGKGLMNGRGYRNGSNSEIEVAQYDDWTVDSIYEREEKLLEFMRTRWDVQFSDEQKKKFHGKD